MSRTFAHKAIDGEYVPGTTAEVDEVLGIGLTLGELGQGVVELAPAGVVGEDLNAPEREVAWMRELARRTGRPVTYALVQHNADPEAWRTMLKLATQAREDGAPLYPQVHGRSPMLLIGLETRTNPFALAPSWREVAGLPLAERAARLRADGDLRARLVAEVKAAGGGLFARSQTSFDNMYPLGAPKPEYEPDPSTSVAAIAARSGKDPVAVMLDVIAEGDGHHLLNVPLFNFSYGSFDPVKEMLEHPTSVLGLGDGGAHCNAICDASMETWMLTHWTRDRAGDRLPVEWVVRKMSRDTAEVYGLLDRGRAGARPEGRREPHRLRGPRDRGSPHRPRPPDRGAPVRPGLDRLRRHHRERPGHHRAGRAHGCAARPAAARRPSPTPGDQRPPLTARVWPVTQDAAGEAR